MSMRILFAALVLAAAITAVGATPAHAGTYVVVGCSDLSGSPIRPTDGWYLAAGAYPSRDQCRSRGGHVPRAGLRVRLQSRGLGAWRTRALLRTDGLGRFTAFGRVPAGARLRVVVPAQPGYPYARGVERP